MQGYLIFPVENFNRVEFNSLLGGKMVFRDHTLGTSMSDLAYGTYQAWTNDVLEIQRQASRSGTKMQKLPIRSAMTWRFPDVPPTGSRLQALPLRNAMDWIDRSGLGGVVSPELGPKGFMLGQEAVVEAVPVQRAAVNTGSLLVGIVLGLVLGRELLK